MKNKLKLFMIICLSLFATTGFGAEIHGCVEDDISLPPCADSIAILFPGGSWASSDEEVATIDPETGEIHVVGEGSAIITYFLSTSCGDFSFSFELIADPLPDPILGPGTVCVGQTIPLASSPSGGTWTSSDVGVATVGSGSGIVTGISDGTAEITYMLSTGCYVTTIVTVYPTPSEITGTKKVCKGATTTLYSTPGGGTWTSDDDFIATVGSGTGIVTGVTDGTVVITYSLSTGCYTTTVVTVYPTPSPISGTTTICVGASTTLNSTPAGGTWSSSDGGVAIVGSGTGIVTGTSGGTSVITYMLPTGCYTTAILTVEEAEITGATSVCFDDNILLMGTPTGGTWSSSDVGVATVGTSGLVSGVSPGTVIISYETAAGCLDTALVTVGDTFSVSICEIAPIQTCDYVLAYCPGMKLAVYGGGAGASYVWNLGMPGTHATVGDAEIFTITSPPVAGHNIVTVTNAGGCSATAAVKFVTPNTCEPCDLFKPTCATCVGCDTVQNFRTIDPHLAVLDTSVISPTIPGNYFIPENSTMPNRKLTASPAPGSVLLMGNNVIIEIETLVELRNVHIFSHPSCRWAGIKVVNNTPNIGQLTIDSNTLIENAGIAVQTSVVPTLATAPSSGDIIFSNNAIYNDNGYGLKILDLMLDTTEHTYPVVVKNSVFSRRNYCNYSIPSATAPTDYYPFVWPTAVSLKAPTTSESGYNPEFVIDTFPVLGDPQIGMWIANSGSADSTISIANPVFYSIVIGDSSDADNYNLFDTLAKGVYAESSNVQFYNNIFSGLPYAGSSEGKGIQSISNATDKNSIDVLSGSNYRTNNRFYNCYYGVAIQGAYQINCNNTEMKSTETTGADNFGIDVGAGVRDISVYNISNNSINNYEYGIRASINNCYISNGSIFIENNKLSGVIPDGSVERCESGIIVSDNSDCTTSNVDLNILSNHITGFTKGIYVLDYSANNPSLPIRSTYINTTISEDTVVVTNLSDVTNTRYGIFCNRVAALNDVSGNYVYGDITANEKYNYPLPAAATSSGVLLQKVSNDGSPSNVSCNHVKDIGIGYRFADTSSIDWHNNVMERHTYGMVLSSDVTFSSSAKAIIGTQGDTCEPADNLWYDDGAGTTGWPGWLDASVYQTFASGANATLSTMYVRNVATGDYIYRPTNNGSSGTATAYSYGTNVLDAASGCGGDLPDPDICAPDVPEESAERMGPGGDGRDIDWSVVKDSHYTLLPNPSDGNIIITQSVAEDASTSVQVMNYAGATVYKGVLDFKGGQSQLQLNNIVPGLYMVNITDAKGETSAFKVVIQN